MTNEEEIALGTDDNNPDSDSDGIGNSCDICPNDAGNDADGDGFCAPIDCNDNSADVKPGAADLICNGKILMRDRKIEGEEKIKKEATKRTQNLTNLLK